MAPALQEKRRELEKQMKEDKLEREIGMRPNQEDLVKRGILKDSKVSPALYEQQAQLERSMLSDNLDHKLKARPGPNDLVEKGIILDKDKAE